MINGTYLLKETEQSVERLPSWFVEISLIRMDLTQLTRSIISEDDNETIFSRAIKEK